MTAARLKAAQRLPTRWLLTGAVLGALVVAGAATYFFPGRAGRSSARPAPSAPKPLVWRGDHEVFATYAGSESCRECHLEAYERWKTSNHGLAERPMDRALDQPFFEPTQTFTIGSQTSTARVDGSSLRLFTLGLSGQVEPFTPDGVIGHYPLRQFLVPTTDGRWQVTELAVDPRSNQWFNVYGAEDRQPGEWGHWTGRGMNWNQMCAICHNTRLRKNYQPVADAYATTMAERSVGCEACHGPLADHVAWQRPRPQPAQGDPTLRKFDKQQVLSYCGACHARRSEFTGDFVPGDDFFDHHFLTFTDETDLYYPDGQVRDEDYEYASFLSSKMSAAGVWCMDCHEPHSAKTRFPGNALCQRCHGPPLAPAPKIDETQHSFHKPKTAGDACVDCHMPITFYMQRHPRHDHGYTIPDPWLTRQHGVPNACNRCHTDKSVDWSIEWTEKWYGPRMNRPSRARAQLVAQAREGRTNVAPALIRLADTDPVPLWRATATRLLLPWNTQPDVTAALLERLADTNANVRVQAVRSLESLAQAGEPRVLAALQPRLSDPVRAVRVQAAWALRRGVDTNSLAGREMLRSLEFNLDQPAGALQYAVFLMDRERADEALVWLRKAASWDRHSAAVHDSLAYCLSLLGRSDEAVEALRTACRLAPKDAQFRYRLGLALNEAGQVSEAAKALEETVKLEPEFTRAWYNLGLAYHALQRSEDALGALSKAEFTEPASAEIPYARATILLRLGQAAEARAAARRALDIQPGHAGAANLIHALSAQ